MGFVYAFLLLNQRYGNEQNSISTYKFLTGQWHFNEHKKYRNIFVKKIILYGLSIGLTAGITYLLVGTLVKEFYVTYFVKSIGWMGMAIVWIRVIP